MTNHPPSLFPFLNSRSGVRAIKKGLFLGGLATLLGFATTAPAQTQDPVNWVPPANYAMPAYSNLSNDPVALRRDVTRFLMQSTFGPSEDDINQLYAFVTSSTYNGGLQRITAYRDWIDQQFAKPQTSVYELAKALDQVEWNEESPASGVQLYGTRTSPGTYNAFFDPGTINRRHAWWTIAVNANDQVRQRAAFALSEIMVASTGDGTLGNYQYGLCNYYDTLATNADQKLSTLLLAVSKHPVMAQYLSHLQNVGPTPDENYARELMQLFSIGLVQLLPDGTPIINNPNNTTDGTWPNYSNTDITNLAHVLTGWSFSMTDSTNTNNCTVIPNSNFLASPGNRFFQSSWLYPMTNFAAKHDTASKLLLGSTINSGLTGDADLANALDIIVKYKPTQMGANTYALPNAAPFIALRLIQRLVTSNPSPGYVYRVAKTYNTGGPANGTLKDMIKAVLTDAEAREFSYADNYTFGKVKEPILRFSHIMRAMKATESTPAITFANLTAVGYPQAANFRTGATVLRYPLSTADLGQTPFEAPSVFNWFQPDYRPSMIAVSTNGAPYSATNTAPFPSTNVAPEMQIITPPQLYGSMNTLRSLATTSKAGDKMVDTSQSVSITLSSVSGDAIDYYVQIYNNALVGHTVTDATTALVDALDKTMMGGELNRLYATAPTPNPRSVIIASIAGQTFPGTSAVPNRVRETIWLIGSSASYITQK